jgi:uncharacterized protein (TIGR02145 family)
MMQYSTNERSQGICPVGWHVPSGRPNEGATNTSHFSALPSGNRNSSGTYNALGFFTDFWTSTFDTGTQSIWYRLLDADHAQIQRVQGYRKYGTTLRCVKD